MGIADHAQKAENSDNLAENQLLKFGLKEFEGKRTTLEWLELAGKKAELIKCLKKVTSPSRKNWRFKEGDVMNSVHILNSSSILIKWSHQKILNKLRKG